MTHPPSFAIKRSISSPPYYSLVTDRSSLLSLPADEPIYDSVEACVARINSLHPSPHPHLSAIIPDEDPPNPTTHFFIFEEPVYCGPDSPSSLSTLLLRYPALWVRDTPFMQNLPPPFRLTTKKLYTSYNIGTFRRLIHSSSVSRRIATRRSNIEADRSELLSGGSFMPPPVFESSLPLAYTTASYLPSSHRNLVQIHHKKVELTSDSRPYVLRALTTFLDRILASVPLSHNHPVPSVHLHHHFPLSLAHQLGPLQPWIPALLAVSSTEPHLPADHPLRPYEYHWQSFFTSRIDCGSCSLSGSIIDSLPWDSEIRRGRHYFKLEHPKTTACFAFCAALSRFLLLCCRIHRIPLSSLTSPAPLDTLPSESTPQESRP